jgi:hypothetical protein
MFRVKRFHGCMHGGTPEFALDLSNGFRNAITQNLTNHAVSNSSALSFEARSEPKARHP